MTPEQIQLAEQASKETDPEKLRILVEQLCKALDEHKPKAAKPDPRPIL